MPVSHIRSIVPLPPIQKGSMQQQSIKHLGFYLSRLGCCLLERQL